MGSGELAVACSDLSADGDEGGAAFDFHSFKAGVVGVHGVGL